MDASPSYKLIYFNFRGKAESIRWMFAYAGVPFEDYRIHELPHYISPEPAIEWAKLQPTLPFGQIPVLVIDGKHMLGQTQAIARYLAKKFKLLGKNEWEEGETDAWTCYIIGEIEGPMLGFIREKNLERKEMLQNNFFTNILPVRFQMLESHLQRNKSNGEDYIVGKTPTWVDFIAVGGIYAFVEWMKPGTLANYPLLKQHSDLVRNLKGVKEWIQNHDSPF